METAAQRLYPAAMEAIETPPGDAALKLVFIIDDDDGLRDILRFVLEREGFETRLFADGSQLLSDLRGPSGRGPDLIVMDLMMPQCGGYEAVRELQAAGAGSVPVVLMTGRTIDPRMGQLLRQESNVVEFMTKPVIPALLAASAHKILKTTRSAGRSKVAILRG